MLHSMAGCICSTSCTTVISKAGNGSPRASKSSTRLVELLVAFGQMALADVGMGSDHTQWLVIWATADHHAPLSIHL